MTMNGYKKPAIEAMTKDWKTNPRWAGITRPYTAADVDRLRGSFQVEYTVARMGAERLWELMETEPFVRALGALSGGQAVQMVQAGLQAIYLSGWQVAADANAASHTYPDQSLYPADSAPKLVQRINNALMRADQIDHMNGKHDIHWMAPIFADAEAGFGGNLNAFELMKMMIEAGAAAVHFEDQLSSAKKCGHMGGKVLVPVQEAINKLVAARLAADVLGVPSIVVARTDAESGSLITSDIDPRDHDFILDEPRTSEGFYAVRKGLEYGIMRALAYAPYADVIWLETSTPDLELARQFADAVHAKFPGKKLAYNCSPSFNWRLNLGKDTIETFQEELGKMGYAFQFVTLAGFHNLNLGMFELASGYAKRGMGAYSEMQEREFGLQDMGFKAIKHQSFVGAGYFDEVQQTVMQGAASTTAMAGSTEEQQFEAVPA
ncbi:MAG: isocitrate lyase, partial [Anaerolineales bacterium]|nr:isocitrate lyase [Anaerolineales bacterium]